MQIGFDRAVGIELGHCAPFNTELRLTNEFFRLAANHVTARHAVMGFMPRYKGLNTVIVALVNDEWSDACELDKVMRFYSELPDGLQRLLFVQTTEHSFPTPEQYVATWGIPKRPEIGFRIVDDIINDPLLDLKPR